MKFLGDTGFQPVQINRKHSIGLDWDTLLHNFGTISEDALRAVIEPEVQTEKQVDQAVAMIRESAWAERVRWGE